MPEPTRKLNVFICHASQDKAIARELSRRLGLEGWLDPWLAEEKLLPGMDWDLEIRKAVKTADAVVVCLSNHWVTQEGYIQRELRLVLNSAEEKPEGAIFIIPLRLDDCPVPTRLERWQYIDFFPARSKAAAYEQLRQSLALRAGTPGVPGIKPPGPPATAGKPAPSTTVRPEPTSNSKPTTINYIHTGGGAYIAGNVKVEGGDFVGRDKVDRNIATPGEAPKE